MAKEPDGPSAAVQLPLASRVKSWHPTSSRMHGRQNFKNFVSHRPVITGRLSPGMTGEKINTSFRSLVRAFGIEYFVYARTKIPCHTELLRIVTLCLLLGDIPQAAFGLVKCIMYAFDQQNVDWRKFRRHVNELLRRYLGRHWLSDIDTISVLRATRKRVQSGA